MENRWKQKRRRRAAWPFNGCLRNLARDCWFSETLSDVFPKCRVLLKEFNGFKCTLDFTYGSIKLADDLISDPQASLRN